MKPTAAAKNQLAYNEEHGITPKQIKRARNAALLGTGNTNADDEVKVRKHTLSHPIGQYCRRSGCPIHV